MSHLEKTSDRESSLLEKLIPWGIVSVAFLASLAAFSKKQRDAIVERDKKKCNYPLPHKCGGELCVHQIIPPRYAEVVGIDPDFPENALTVCKNIQAGEDGIFPDLGKARAEYAMNTDSFNEAVAERARKLARKEIYWDATHDREMTATAMRNTQKAKKDGWIFPIKKTRSKKSK